MFGFPLWAIQLIVVVLRACGLESWADAIIIKTVTTIVGKVEKLKTYHSTGDFPDPPPSVNPNRNFNTGGDQ